MSFDSFIMLNIYPLRATDPKKLPELLNAEEHIRNMEVILEVIKDGSTIWAAWGDLIYSRSYLIGFRNTIYEVIQENKKDIHWVKMGELTMKGNPRHPLYLKYQPFSKFKP
jgi:hypothetical protein